MHTYENTYRYFSTFIMSHVYDPVMEFALWVLEQPDEDEQPSSTVILENGWTVRTWFNSRLINPPSVLCVHGFYWDCSDPNCNGPWVLLDEEERRHALNQAYQGFCPDSCLICHCPVEYTPWTDDMTF